MPVVMFDLSLSGQGVMLTLYSKSAQSHGEYCARVYRLPLSTRIRLHGLGARSAVCNSKKTGLMCTGRVGYELEQYVS